MDLDRPALACAPALLGWLLTDGEVTLRVTEVEAYGGRDDPAAHAFGGPRPHTRDLFEPPGTLYCYRSYGLHICGNVVCGPSGSGQAVLFRAGEVVAGLDVAVARRGPMPAPRLARGPGCLGKAMGWSLEDSGRRFGSGGLLLAPPAGPVGEVRSGPRVGVSVAHRRPWRFWLAREASVSSYRASPRIRDDG